MAGQDGLSVIQVWPDEDEQGDDDDQQPVSDISGRKRPREKDDKEALRAHIEALFADLK